MERAEPGGRPRPSLRRYRDDARRHSGPDAVDRVDPWDTGRSGESDVVARGGAGDLAVTVLPEDPPEWLVDRLARSVVDLLDLPTAARTRAAIAARHGREPAEVLLTPGGTEPWELVAREFRPAHAMVVHPQPGVGEAALRAAGHPVARLVLDAPFRLDPAQVPDDADLVLIANPTNPTSVGHPRDVVRALQRPGRVVVVDETLADCVPGQRDSVADVVGPGLVVIRALPPAWDLARVRIGYLLAAPDLARRLGQWQSAWPVSTTALAAARLVTAPDVGALVGDWALELAGRRAAFVAAVADVPGVDVVPDAVAAFVLLDHAGGSATRMTLREKGFLVRRGDTFPGLGPSWLRVAVPDVATGARFAGVLRAAVGQARSAPDGAWSDRPSKR